MLIHHRINQAFPLLLFLAWLPFLKSSIFFHSEETVLQLHETIASAFASSVEDLFEVSDRPSSEIERDFESADDENVAACELLCLQEIVHAESSSQFSIHRIFVGMLQVYRRHYVAVWRAVYELHSGIFVIDALLGVHDHREKNTHTDVDEEV